MIFLEKTADNMELYVEFPKGCKDGEKVLEFLLYIYGIAQEPLIASTIYLKVFIIVALVQVNLISYNSL